MRRLLVAALMFAVGAMPAAEGSRLLSDAGTDDLRLLTGIAPPIRHASIRGITRDLADPFDQELSSVPSVGPRLGLRYLHGTWFTPAVGIKYGLDAVWSRSSGTVTDRDSEASQLGDRDFLLTTTAVGAWLGPTFRVDIDSLEVPADALEFELLVGGGPARMRASTDKRVSHEAPGVRYGLSLGMIVTTFDRWQIGLEGGGEILFTRQLQWSNTDASIVSAYGFVGGLQLGHRW